MRLPRVLVLTDRTQVPPARDLTHTVVSCVEAGATHIVLRELDLSTEERTKLAGDLLAIPGIALIAAHIRLPGVEAVHVAARQPTPPGVHGRSCHNEAEIRMAVAEGAAYVTASPASPTQSKPGYGPPLGQSGMRRLTGVADGLPVFALGGIEAGNAARFRDAGAYGVAVMGALMRATDPAALTQRLLAEVTP